MVPLIYVDSTTVYLLAYAAGRLVYLLIIPPRRLPLLYYYSKSKDALDA